MNCFTNLLSKINHALFYKNNIPNIVLVIIYIFKEISYLSKWVLFLI